jgi:outer membrane protein assembly factor BamB
MAMKSIGKTSCVLAPPTSRVPSSRAEKPAGGGFFRSGCVNGTLKIAPVVHRLADASATFQATYNDDLVYVGSSYATSTGCTGGYNTDNVAYALSAADGSIEWTFNGSATHDVDIVVGMALDVASDRLYVTTDRTSSPSQDSIWAVNVLTGSDVWSVNAGRLLTAPVLHDGRLYVTALAGTVSAYDAATGAALWTSASLGAPFASDYGGDPVVVARPDGDVWIAAVDFGGTVHVLRDDDTSATVLQSIALSGTSGETRDTLVADAQGRALVSANEGRLYPVDLVAGTVGTPLLVDATAGAEINGVELEPPGAFASPASVLVQSSTGYVAR